MPRAVLVAIASVSLFGLFAVPVIAVSLFALFAPARVGADVAHLLSWIFVVVSMVGWVVGAILVVRGLVRRSARTRQLAFRLALAGSVAVGLVAVLVILLTRAVTRVPSDAADWFAVVAPLVLAETPLAAIAWSLSRPSAKAWCEVLVAARGTP